MTKNGQVILNIIEKASCHPTAEEMYRLIFKQGKAMSVATVYNNLNCLSEHELIRKISIPGQPDRYDNLNRHDHLVCRKCGKITDVYLTDRSKDFEQETGVKIDNYDLQLFYTCNQCQSKKEG